MTKTAEHSITHNNIKALVDERYESVYQFWKASGLNNMTAYGLYNDPSLYPAERTMVILCRLFGVSPSEIIEIDLSVPSRKTQPLIDALEEIRTDQRMSAESFSYLLKAHCIDEPILEAVNGDQPLEPESVRPLKKFLRKHGLTRHRIGKIFAEVEVEELAIA